MIHNVPLVLASSSPRRAELLTSAGFDFVVIPADVDETPRAAERAPAYALRVAHAKAERVSAGLPPDCVVLAADTVVVSGGRLMGKPTDDADAVSMLRLLSGSVHEVHTAVVICGPARKVNRVVTTRVRFQPLSEAEIQWYVATGEPHGKAGAYGIQGLAARFIDSIDGSWSNVVGLPISTVYRMLKEVGAPV
jgi:septum formation protein